MKIQSDTPMDAPNESWYRTHTKIFEQVQQIHEALDRFSVSAACGIQDAESNHTLMVQTIRETALNGIKKAVCATESDIPGILHCALEDIVEACNRYMRGERIAQKSP